MPDTNKEHIDKKAKTSTHTNLRKKVKWCWYSVNTEFQLL